MFRRVDIGGIQLQVSGALLLAAAILFPLLPGHGAFLCPLRSVTGIPCPFCGMTTSVVATSRGQFTEAVASNPAGVLAVIGAILLLALRPRSLRIPVGALIAVVAGMWLFQLFRFAVL